MKTLTRQEWARFIERLIREDAREVVGVVSKGEKFVFDELETPQDLRLDYDVTLLPPKKYFLPPKEELMTFSLGEFRNEMVHDEPPRILVGVHPYDLIAIQQMDKVYLDENPDEHYEKRRENTLIIASDIINVAERSFSKSMGTHKVSSGYDLLVTDLGDRIVIDIGSEKGKNLLEQYASGTESEREDLEAIVKHRARTAAKYRTKINMKKEDWPRLLETNYKHTVWENKSVSCLECGSCTNVCPTCYCFDVKDENSLDLKEGVRKRTWDSCQLKDFTLVAGGEVFRERTKDRFRHRFYRKGKYLPDRYDFIACVGCGRCSTACLPDIADPTQVFNHLNRSKDITPVNLTIPEEEKRAVKKPIMKPREAVIKSKEKLTSSETRYVLQFKNGEPLGHKPGQFVEVSLSGVGEAPISVSSKPADDTFELVVRAVGDLTNKLEEKNVGDSIGIRGPMGNGFNVDELTGKDIIFISGGLGIVPMRSLIESVLERRDEFGSVTMLYGCKEPLELLFKEELEQWGGHDDVNQLLTVDQCPENQCWEENVGLITTLIPDLDLDPENTIAVIIGPPIMYHFVISELEKKDVPHDNILVSLERRMKCGVGKCGHCQINGVYVCLEGPVFNYGEIKELPEAFTLGY